MSPRISVVRTGVRGEFKPVELAEARRSEGVAGFCWAAPGNEARETAKQQQAKRLYSEEIILIPLTATIYLPAQSRKCAQSEPRAKATGYLKMLFSFSKKPFFFGFSCCRF